MSKYLPKCVLESIAGRVLRAYSSLPEVSATDLLYVDPELLLNALLGLDVEYRHLSPDGLTLGMTAFDEIGVELAEEEEELFFLDGKTVLIEKELQGGRKNFTIVHEGCHHILKMLYPRDYGCSVAGRQVIHYRNTHRQKSQEEWQVDYLTSLILMPRQLVEQAMGIVGLNGKIDMLNAIWRKQEYEAFCNMCLILGVSKQALTLRMQRLGLLGPSFLGRPNEILDIWKDEREHD